ncbi:MAG: hypothetical protein AAF984_01495 [Verrucomicrobiota bacterium]
MKAMMTKVVLSVILTTIMLSQDLMACSVCFGAKGDKVTESIGLAILFMVLLIGMVLTGLTAGAVVLFRREKKYANAKLA